MNNKKEFDENITEEDIFGEDDIYEDVPEECFYTDEDYKGDYDGCIPIFRNKNGKTE